ncbi:uncharacterized protein egr [Halyomorpha halys]|uniref:uncharacterized protein egr n=1 Tax=Halyomorpha halys TaxID=286706 RepID=UPI0006D4F1F2|nr:uncharacterized protein LOC106685455 [Halyomorpha halys]
MEGRDRQVIVYFVVALAASLGLGLAIAYLEVKRNQEIIAMQKEILELRNGLQECLTKVENVTQKVQEQLKSYDGVGIGADGDDYYYDDYEDEDKDSGQSNSKDDEEKRESKKTKREIPYSPLLGQPYNLIIKQSYKSRPNKTDPEVKAHIIVHTDQQGYEYAPETHKQAGPMLKSVDAIHFQGNTDRFSRHRHHGGRSGCSYDANHRMCHVRGIFKDWAPSLWSGIDVRSTFKMKDGEVSLLKSPGIYYFYSQIFYADNHDISGYRVYVNGEPVFQCMITNLHHEDWIPGRITYKKNSCYTGGLLYLDVGDHVSIKEIDNLERYSMFKPYKSYFGLFKVFDVPSSENAEIKR